MLEFTGERVVPGQVPADLWNEHLARYRFAARLAPGKLILDAGCGSGYGSATLAKTAESVVGVDVSIDALTLASREYSAPNVSYVAGDVCALPFPAGAFDLVVAFEVIEHLDRWPDLLREAARVLTLRGQLVVSTPNRDYYGESRKAAGPNPFHAREFTFAEFEDAVREVFPFVSLFVQNHVSGIAFQPARPGAHSTTDLSIERNEPRPTEAHFFVAVCARTPQTGTPTYLYIPATANLLRERERHIGLLEVEIARKDGWLTESRAEHAALVEIYEEQAADLRRRTEWAAHLQSEIDRVRALHEQQSAEFAERTEWAINLQSEITRVRALHQEQEVELAHRTEWARELEAELALARRHFEEQAVDLAQLEKVLVQERAGTVAMVNGYEQKVSELEQELTDLHQAALKNTERLEAEVEQRTTELLRCAGLLEKMEAALEDRTRETQNLQARIQHLEQVLELVGQSRWLRLGRSLGLGPTIGER